VARILYIKPEFFDSEQVASVSLGARLLFAGLWTLADREGRFDLAPRRIRAKLFPYDGFEIEPLFDELFRADLVAWYRVAGNLYGWMPGFVKHQRPHPNEAKSTIPPCPPDRPLDLAPWNVTSLNVVVVAPPDSGNVTSRNGGTLQCRGEQNGEGNGDGDTTPASPPGRAKEPPAGPRQRGGLIRGPGQHARLLQHHAFAGERVLVPHEKHAEFVRSVGGNSAETRLSAWYSELDQRVTLSGEPINHPNTWKWLQAEFDAWRVVGADAMAVDAQKQAAKDFIAEQAAIAATVPDRSQADVHALLRRRPKAAEA
jgi:hypothetical protein